MTRRALLGITSHGNAPYLMAARFARALGDFDVVIPHYYGEAQKAILMEEIPEMADRIFLSKALGDVFRPLLLDARNGLSFSEFGNLLARDDHPFSVRAIENRFKSMLDDGIPAKSLGTAENKIFHKADFAAAINTTLPVRANLPKSYFFFTARMSDLYGLAPEGDVSTETISTLQALQPYVRLWAQVEETFDMQFLPRINALSYRVDYHEPKVVFTPPFAFTRPTVRMLQKESWLFIPSGTRTDLYKLYQIAETLPAEFDRLVLGSQGYNPDFPPGNFKYVGAAVFGDPLLKGVISRGGWGSIWESLANDKPMALARTTFSEDPEMGHTQMTMRKLGMADIINGGNESFWDDSRRENILSAMEAERQKDFDEFSSFASDGYAYIAHKIHETDGI